MKVEFIDEDGNVYKTIYPPTNEVTVQFARSYNPGLQVLIQGKPAENIPETHRIQVAETVGQQPVGG